MTGTSPGGDADLELLALARLGIAPSLGSARPPAPGESLLDALVRQGALAKHQVTAVRSYVARHAVTCRCGQRALAPEGTEAFACPGCTSSLLRHSQTGSWRSTGGAPQIQVGSRVGPLVLVELLGKGATGSVFKARHEKLGRFSALKVLPQAALDLRKRKRFEREVEALARLDHAAIVKVHATYEEAGCLCADMELIAGETLEKRLEKGPLPWREAASLVAKIARGVAHAHRAGIIHRDIKPANVLVKEHDGEPVLADFGLTKITDETSSLTVAGGIMGTPVYMAPEAFNGSVDPKVDVYGLGAVLYHALTGRPPFQEGNLSALFFKVSRGDCPKTAAPGAPRDLELVRARAMEPAPSQRYKTADDLADDLEKLLRGERVSDSLVSSVSRATRRPTFKIAVAVFASVASLLAAWVLTRERPKVVVPAFEGPNLATVEGALEALEKGERDPARRSQAFQTLAFATRPAAAGQATLLRDLDAAILRSPRPAELRHVRALLARQRGHPVRADDLAAVGSSAGGTNDLELLASHALSAGLAGEGTLAPVRAVWRAFPDQPTLALLFALTACQKGDPSSRDEVVRAFKAARPQQDKHAFVARAFSDADRLVQILDESDFRGDGFEGTLKGRLTQAVHELSRDSQHPAALKMVLAPVGPALRRTWRRVLVVDVMRSARRTDLVTILDGAATEDDLPPQLLAMREILRTADMDKDLPMKASIGAIDRASIALVDEDPLVAAILAEHVGALESKPLDDARWAFERFARAERCIENFLASTTPSEAEEYFVATVTRRCAVDRANYLERSGLIAKSPDERVRDLEASLEERRRAFKISTDRPSVLQNLRMKDARLLVRCLEFLGRLEDCDKEYGLYEAFQGGYAIKAEVERRRGRHEKALRLLDSLPSELPDKLAVLALVEADLGHKDRARAALDSLLELEKSLRSWFEFLQSDRIAPRVQGER